MSVGRQPVIIVMQKYADTSLGGVPLRALLDPRAMASLGASNLSVAVTGEVASAIRVSKNAATAEDFRTHGKRFFSGDQSGYRTEDIKAGALIKMAKDGAVLVVTEGYSRNALVGEDTESVGESFYARETGSDSTEYRISDRASIESVIPTAKIQSLTGFVKATARYNKKIKALENSKKLQQSSDQLVKELREIRERGGS